MELASTHGNDKDMIARACLLQQESLGEFRATFRTLTAEDGHAMTKLVARERSESAGQHATAYPEVPSTSTDAPNDIPPPPKAALDRAATFSVPQVQEKQMHQLLRDFERDVALSSQAADPFPPPLPPPHGATRGTESAGDELNDDQDAEILDEGEASGRIFSIGESSRTHVAPPPLISGNFVEDENDDDASLDALFARDKAPQTPASDKDQSGVEAGEGACHTVTARQPSQQREGAQEWEEALEAFSLDKDFDYENCALSAPPDLEAVVALYEATGSLPLRN